MSRMKIGDVEIDDAEVKIAGIFRNASIIERRNKRRKAKIVDWVKNPTINRVRSKAIRIFIIIFRWVINSKDPTQIDFTILQELIRKKFGCSARAAFDYASAILYIYYC